jgi:hypothetical protein
MHFLADPDITWPMWIQVVARLLVTPTPERNSAV